MIVIGIGHYTHENTMHAYHKCIARYSCHLISFTDLQYHDYACSAIYSYV